ncbi:MAG: undecaprenyl/decaprenyl-phosphate alpha-N-acetylglucosaminyl 1-phosphate transferase [Lewinellaceae bacterium]|nr:undecaprenyl/decaprenyl-phosphate alpha-N-acetylglucosaminyl 1-phosphate transferase [Lewinellaceae bacterium]
MPALLLTFITAFALTYATIPTIIRVAMERHLYDLPNERSAHKVPTPSLGGIGIFGGTFCAIILWAPYGAFDVMQYLLAAFMIIFLIGVRDDLLPISPTRKFLAQLLAAFILVYKSGVKLTSFYGIFGLYELPELSGIILSIMAIVGIINAFNLIDGINGLAASIGLVACLVWGSWFFAANHLEMATIAFALAGALIAFLKFNLQPARIFMGDTGSLFVGLVCAILAIQFIELQPARSTALWSFKAAPAIAVSILIFPLFDTLRVFARRVMAGRSPFAPDKTHLHHKLLELGLSHQMATLALVMATLCFIGISILLDDLGNFRLLLLQLLLASGLSGLLFRWAAIRAGAKNG